MKTVLSCDDVFEILTRAPFPAGQSNDSDVELHLSSCHDCRCLAEALRPAVELFHEATDEPAYSQLPVYLGSLDAPDVSRRSPPMIFPRPALAVSRSRLERYIAAASLGTVAVCLLVLLSVSRAGWFDARDPATKVPGVALLAEQGVARLATLHLPEECLNGDDPRSSVDAEDAVHRKYVANGKPFRCCTHCHHASSSVPSTSQVVFQAAVACLACHEASSVTLSQPRDLDPARERSPI